MNTDLARVHPRLLDSLAQAHPWALGAIGELLHNAESNAARRTVLTLCPDTLGCRDHGGRGRNGGGRGDDGNGAGGGAGGGDGIQYPAENMLVVCDDGDGLDRDGMRGMLRFGGHSEAAQGTSRYGVGFKSGSARLGGEAVVLSRRRGAAGGTVCGVLSRSGGGDGEDVLRTPVFELGGPESAQAASNAGLDFTQLCTLSGVLFGSDASARSGVCIFVRRLRTVGGGLSEVLLEGHQGVCDITLRRDADGRLVADGPLRARSWIELPRCDWSLRAYCAIMFGGPGRMDIFIAKDFKTLRQVHDELAIAEARAVPRAHPPWHESAFAGARVSQLRLLTPVGYERLANRRTITLSVAHGENGAKHEVDVMFGRLDTLQSRTLGIHIYWRGVLIQALHVPEHMEVEFEGVDQVLGVCDVGGVLEPLNNKQGFSPLTPGYRDFFRQLKTAMLDYAKPEPVDGDDAVEADVEWIQCESCKKWRMLDDERAGQWAHDVFLCEMAGMMCRIPEEEHVSGVYVEKVNGRVVRTKKHYVAKAGTGGSGGQAGGVAQHPVLRALELQNPGDLVIGGALGRDEPGPQHDEPSAGAEQPRLTVTPPVAVHKARWHGCAIAVKLVNSAHQRVARKEFEQLACLRFPHVVQLLFFEPHFSWRGKPHAAIGMELLSDYGPLDAWLAQAPHKAGNKWFRACVKCCVVEQQAAALAYLHEFGVCHNDIQPRHVLIRVRSGDDAEPARADTKLIGFSLARRAPVRGAVAIMASDHTSHELGSGLDAFRAPEKQQAGAAWRPTCAADMFSFGVLMHCIAHNNMFEATANYARADFSRRSPADVFGDGAHYAGEDTVMQINATVGARCRRHSADERPSASELAKRIKLMLEKSAHTSLATRFKLRHGGKYCWHVVNEVNQKNYAEALDERAAILPKGNNPNVTAAKHVRENPVDSPWVSLTASLHFALFYMVYPIWPKGWESKKPRVILKIDMDELVAVGRHFLDLCDPIPASEEKSEVNRVVQARNNAINASEVLVCNGVPSEAIVERYLFRHDAKDPLTVALTRDLNFPFKPSLHTWLGEARVIGLDGLLESGMLEAGKRAASFKKNLRPEPPSATFKTRQEQAKQARKKRAQDEGARPAPTDEELTQAAKTRRVESSRAVSGTASPASTMAIDAVPTTITSPVPGQTPARPANTSRVEGAQGAASERHEIAEHVNVDAPTASVASAARHEIAERVDLDAPTSTLPSVSSANSGTILRQGPFTEAEDEQLWALASEKVDSTGKMVKGGWVEIGAVMSRKPDALGRRFTALKRKRRWSVGSSAATIAATDLEGGAAAASSPATDSRGC